MNSKWKTDNDNGESGKSTAFSISPQAGYFVANNLAVGIELPISYSKSENDNSSSLSTKHGNCPLCVGISRLSQC